jgi:hypothetical protein
MFPGLRLSKRDLYTHGRGVLHCSLFLKRRGRDFNCPRNSADQVFHNGCHGGLRSRLSTQSMPVVPGASVHMLAAWVRVYTKQRQKLSNLLFGQDMLCRSKTLIKLQFLQPC